MDLFIVATGQKMVGRNFFKVREKSGNFTSSRENSSLGKRSAKSSFKSIYFFFFLYFYCFITFKIL